MKDNSIVPSRSPVCVELKRPSLCCSWECSDLDYSCIVYSRLSFGFLVFGEGNIYECGSVFTILFVSLFLFSLFFQSAQFLYSPAASRMRGQADPTGVAHLPSSARRGGRMDFRLIKKLYRILDFLLICPRIC